MKPLGIIFLSVLVLYAGVASAFEACLRHDGHSDHRVAENHHNSAASSQHTHPEDESVPVIHCTVLIHDVGPAVRVAATGITLSDKGVVLHLVSLPHAVSSVLKNDLWLEALFKNILTFSSPNNLSRHLFLSILQI
jgi:hypothetical protein